MTTHRFSKAFRFVLARAVNEQRMEENNISFLHLQVNSVVLKLLVGFNAEVRFVYIAFLRILVIVESAFMALWQNIQASILFVAVL